MDIIIDKDFLNDPVAFLQRECARRGLSMSQLCDDAKIDRSTVERWKVASPKTMDIINRLQTSLTKAPVITSGI